MRWSISSDETFRRCQRQYFFSQIMASARARDLRRREAYVLKQLKSLSAWQGSLVHQGIARFVVPALQRREPIDLDMVIKETVALARRQFAFSMAGRYRDPALSKEAAGDGFCALFEHEYGGVISDGAVHKVETVIERCFRNLCRHRDFLAYLSGRPWYGVELPLTVPLDGATLGVQLDLLFFRRDGQPTIVDWKVEQAGDNSRQMMVYALAVARSPRWRGVRPEAIEIYEANLFNDVIKRHLITEERLEEAEDFVLRSVARIRALTGDPRFEGQHFADYEVANSPMACEYCPFQRLCLEMSKWDGIT